MCSGMWLHLQDLKSLEGLNLNTGNQEEGTNDEKAENTIVHIKYCSDVLPVSDVGGLHWVFHVTGLRLKHIGYGYQ